LGFCYIIRALHFLRLPVTKKTRFIFWLIFFTLLFLTGLSHAEKPHYDFIICGARVIDGTGAPWYVADIGIVGDRLAAIGDLSKVSAAKRLNAAGLFASPGFIDVQGQSEFNILADNRAASKITQGVTTEITGEGNSIAPVNDCLRKDLEEKAIKYGVTLDWYSLADYFRHFETCRPATSGTKESAPHQISSSGGRKNRQLAESRYCLHHCHALNMLPPFRLG
jgi:hypothetical protein